MGINIGNKELLDAKLGSKQILEIYLGDKLIWPTLVGGLYPVVEAIYKIHGIQPLLYLPLNGNLKSYLSKITLDESENSVFINNARFGSGRVEVTEVRGKHYILDKTNSANGIVISNDKFKNNTGLSLFFNIEANKDITGFALNIAFGSFNSYSAILGDIGTLSVSYYGKNSSGSKLSNLSYSGDLSEIKTQQTYAILPFRKSKTYSADNNIITAVSVLSDKSSSWFQNYQTCANCTGIYIDSTGNEGFLQMASVLDDGLELNLQDFLVYDTSLTNWFLSAINTCLNWKRDYSNGFEYKAPMSICFFIAPYDAEGTLFRQAVVPEYFNSASTLITGVRDNFKNVYEGNLNFPDMGVTNMNYFDANTQPYTNNYTIMLNGTEYHNIHMRITFNGTLSNPMYLIGYTENNRAFDSSKDIVLGKFHKMPNSEKYFMYSFIEKDALEKYAGKILWTTIKTSSTFKIADGIIDAFDVSNSIMEVLCRNGVANANIGTMFDGTVDSLDVAIVEQQWASITGTVKDQNNSPVVKFAQGIEPNHYAWDVKNSQGSYLRINTSLNTEATKNIAFTLCFKVTGNQTAGQALFGYNYDDKAAMGVSCGTTSGGNLRIKVYLNNITLSLPTEILEVNKWYHVVFSGRSIMQQNYIRSFEMRAKVNGKLYEELKTGLSATSISFSNLGSVFSNSQLPFGAGISWTQIGIETFEGLIQDFFMWSDSLAPSVLDDISNYYLLKGLE